MIFIKRRINKKKLLKLISKIIYSIPIFSQYNPRKKLTTFNALSHVQTLPDVEEIMSKGWYLPIRQSETIHRKPPISLKDDLEDAKFNTMVAEYQYGYKHSIPEVFLSCVPKAKILSKDFIISSDDNYIFFDSIFSCYTILENMEILDEIILPPLKYYTGCYCVIGMLWADNYYHWIFDILPRISLIEQFEELRNIRLIFPKKLKKFQKDSLQLAGVSSERIVEFDEGYWQVDKLYFPSLLGITGSPTPWSVSWLRARFLDNLFSHTSSTGHYLYLTRRDVNKRRIINEDKIIEVLKDRGFEVICPGELSFLEQIKTFSQARVIIAPHGAGLTNMVFAPANAVLIEMLPENFTTVCYWALTNICGHSYAFLTGPCENEDFYISLDRLKALLDKVFENLK